MLLIKNGKTTFNPHQKNTMKNQMADSVLTAISKIKKGEYMDKPSAVEVQNTITEALSWLEDQGVSYIVECFGDEDTLEIVTSIERKDLEN